MKNLSSLKLIIGIILVSGLSISGSLLLGNILSGDLNVGARTSNFWKTVSGKLQTVNDRAVKITGDLEFMDEIKPDGATCSNGELLKRTGADNWDCVATSSLSITATIGADSVATTALQFIDTASDNELISYDSATGQLSWTTAGSLAIADVYNAIAATTTLLNLTDMGTITDLDFVTASGVQLTVTGQSTLAHASSTMLTVSGGIYGDVIGDITGTASGNLTSADISTLALLNAIVGDTIASTTANLSVFTNDSGFITASSTQATFTGNVWANTFIGNLTGTVTGDLTCTDCLNATEIEDIYLLDTGDTGTGDYTINGDLEVDTATSTRLYVTGDATVTATTTSAAFSLTNDCYCRISTSTTGMECGCY